VSVATLRIASRDRHSGGAFVVAISSLVVLGSIVDDHAPKASCSSRLTTAESVSNSIMVDRLSHPEVIDKLFIVDKVVKLIRYGIRNKGHRLIRNSVTPLPTETMHNHTFTNNPGRHWRRLIQLVPTVRAAPVPLPISLKPGEDAHAVEAMLARQHLDDVVDELLGTDGAV
jgi:hypothetical protein